MKSALMLFLGLALGAAAHIGWFEWRRPADPGADVVAWMQADLQLTAAQAQRIRALHEASGPQLRELAAQAAIMRAELDAFETTRRSEGRVDFLAFARFVEDWRRIDRLAAAASRELIAATAGELDAAQRARYFARLNPGSPRSVN
jgi:capsule polysaccharide export protein KpsE/RkpR